MFHVHLLSWKRDRVSLILRSSGTPSTPCPGSVLQPQAPSCAVFLRFQAQVCQKIETFSRGCSSDSQVSTYMQAQGKMCSFGLHILHQKLFPVLWEAAGRKGDGPRTWRALRNHPDGLWLAEISCRDFSFCKWDKTRLKGEKLSPNLC